MKKIFGFIFALSMTVLTVGCGDSSLTISSNSNGTQVQNVQKEAERLTFSLDSKEYSVPIPKVESINKYLEQFDQSDRETEIKRMQATAFTSKSGIIYGDFQYSCGTKLCNHTLVQIKNDEIKSVPLHSGSIFSDHAFSPNEKNLAILLGKNEGTDVVRNSVMIINTESLTLAELNDASDIVNKLTSTDFSIPILSLNWENDTTLKITIPDLTNYSFETLEQWQKKENNTKEATLSIK
ncbi:hypothetical protein ABE237_21540 [Brevibacillus formosus]|uniref:hypothetical protein n=1 Tax=Brevibacillus formosus TaxID=54913 RepID=UPI0018CD859A|nr:hypothetical protein [Brevibacillus formosus]MBG9941038.1 hypothetical protein [Brevibacillus formosus]